MSAKEQSEKDKIKFAECPKGDKSDKTSLKPRKSSSAFRYQHSLMYGRYTNDLADYAKDEAKRIKILEKNLKADQELRRKELFHEKLLCRSTYTTAVSNGIAFLWQRTFGRVGEDWAFLFILGVVMAILSFIMDWGISMCRRATMGLYMALNHHIIIQYLAWTTLPIFLVLFSAGLVHIIAPQAIGSGIPEMKTILRGVELKEYLSFRTLFAKVVGLTASLGSGMPLGKEGAFVHIASMVATLMTKLKGFKRIRENESRSHAMLGTACAVGVACCFACPIGGVLFSIEVTAVYFAVRDYWRGFFAAGIGAITFRLLAVWLQGQGTIKPVFKTFFGGEFPYDPQELFVFGMIGVVSGLLGALFIWMHCQYVLWMRRNEKLNTFLKQNRFIYPGFVSWFIASANFPLGFGQFIAGDLSTHNQVLSLFSNFSWTKGNFSVGEASVLKHWVNPYTGIFVNLSLYFWVTFLFFMVASTLPVPCGMFVPTFRMGAALGRLFGEAMHVFFPFGISFSGGHWPIVPGGYAVVGAAAFSGAVTRTISIVVIASEMTGQITHILPIMLSVLIANGVAGALQPSIFDSISIIKKLPYLPDFIPSSSAGAYNITVKDFMIHDIQFIWYSMTYKELKAVLKENRSISSFPIVDSFDGMILLGSIHRHHLIGALIKQIGRERRIQSVAKWRKEMNGKFLGESAREEQSPQLTELKQQKSALGSWHSTCSLQNLTCSSGSISKRFSPHPDPVPKSILKNANSSFILYNSDGEIIFNSDSTGPENRLKTAFRKISQKLEELPDLHPETTAPAPVAVTQEPQVNIQRKVSRKYAVSAPSVAIPKKTVQLPTERVIDMSPEEQQDWEEEQMALPVNFSSCPIDEAPFQLVAETTLLKAHSIFSLLGINCAYVTATGKLIGVVAMKELRFAIEGCNSGTFRRPSSTVDFRNVVEDKEVDPESGHGKGQSERHNSSVDSAVDTDAGESTDDEGVRNYNISSTL